MSISGFDLVDVLITSVAWSIALIKFGKVRHDSAWTADRLALSTWLFSFFFAIAMTFQVRLIFENIDAVTFNNLTWLLSYIALALAMGVVIIGMLNSFLKVHAFDRIGVKSIKSLLAITLVILILLYGFSISRLPENIERNLPSTFAEMLFMETMYIYGTPVCVLAVYVYVRQIRIEKVVSTRIRTIAMLAVVSLALLSFVAKILITYLGFYKTNFYLNTLIRIYTLALLSGGLIWMSVFLPNKLYMFLAKPWEFINDWLIYLDLERLATRINSFCPGIKDSHASLLDFIQNPDYHLYRVVIYILDCKVMLSDLLSRENARSPAAAWDTNKRQRAEQLNQVLQTVQIEDDFWEMVRAYRNTANRINQLNLAGNQGEALL